MSNHALNTPEESEVSNSLYDRDFYAWANQQAELLRMGRGEKRELVNRLSVLLLQLLKWQYQPAHGGNSWRLTIEEQRYRLETHLNDNPSLKAQLKQAKREAYRLALIDAQRETGLARKSFPPECPYTYEAAIDPDFWPEQPDV
jgi:hypothetical protein